MANIAQLTMDVKTIEDFNKFSQQVRTKVIENGLDTILNTSLQKLKTDLLYIINNRVKDVDTSKGVDTLGNEKINVPKSDQEIIKVLTGADITKINTSKQYTTITDHGAMVVNDNRAKLRIPISPYEEFDSVHTRAKNFFNNALFVFRDGNQTKYYQNPGIDISQYVKVVCSTDVGDTDKSKKVFRSYRDSKKREVQDYSEIGRYSEWTLKQDGIKRIMAQNSGFVDLSQIVNKIKESDFDGAIELAQNLKDNNTGDKTVEKIEALKSGSETSDSSKAYFNIIKLVKNLEINKAITSDIVSYQLTSSFDGSLEDLEEDELYDQFTQTMSFWTIENDNVWTNELVKVAEKTIEEFYKEG